MKKVIITGVIVLLVLAGIVFYNRRSSSSTGVGNIQSNDYKVTSTSSGDKDCADFSSQKEAQEFFENQGGPAHDPHGLDRDKDGVVCETLK